MKGRASHKKRKSSTGLNRRTGTQTWNLVSQPFPAFNNTIKKDNSIHRFIQTTDLGTIASTSVSTPVFYARAFLFTDVVQVASLQVLFDQYRIDDIEAWISVPACANSAAANNVVMFYSVVDYDDDAAPTQLSTLQQYTNVTTTTCSNGHYIKFKPHVAEALYSGAFTSYGNITAPWIDSASSTVKHYGIKLGVATAVAAGNAVTMSLRIHFSCRNVY
jgi:hypothetical protein